MTTMNTIDELLLEHQVDLAHARHVADLAVQLYDALQAEHEWPRGARRLLETGALLHNLGMTLDPETHHLLGRNLVLDEPLSGFDPAEQAMVACLVAFHRKKVRPEQEPAFVRLKPGQQRLVLQLAALLRVADGLDWSETQSSRIEAFEQHDGRQRLLVSGPYAGEEVARALKKSDTWPKAFGGPLEILAQPGVTEPQTAAPAVLEQSSVAQPVDGAVGVSEPLEATAALVEPNASPLRSASPPASVEIAGQPLAKFGRQALFGAFEKLLRAEADVRKSDDVEAVHDMRVATRRLRAGLLVFAAAYDQPMVRRLRRGLRRVAADLGEVRDRDVFLEHLTASTDDAEGLAPLLELLQTERQLARARLLEHLEAVRYQEFRREMARFLTTPGLGDARPEAEAGEILPGRVRDLAGSQIWQRYEELRSYEPGLLQASELTLHRCRIAGKRLRYTLELLEPALGTRAKQALEPLRELQELLGTIQDAVVAEARIAALPQPTPALQQYAEQRAAQRHAALENLPRVSSRVFQASYRRVLAELIVKL